MNYKTKALTILAAALLLAVLCIVPAAAYTVQPSPAIGTTQITLSDGTNATITLYDHSAAINAIMATSMSKAEKAAAECEQLGWTEKLEAYVNAGTDETTGEPVYEQNIIDWILSLFGANSQGYTRAEGEAALEQYNANFVYNWKNPW